MGQLGKRKVYLAGIQEARAFSSGKSILGDFVVCRAAADAAGGHGCSIAVNIRQPWAINKESPSFVTTQDVSIESAEPRTLCVAIKTSAFNILPVSAHGPLPSSSDIDCAEYWKKIGE